MVSLRKRKRFSVGIFVALRYALSWLIGGFACKHIHNPNGLPTITVGVMRLYLWMEIRG